MQVEPKYDPQYARPGVKPVSHEGPTINPLGTLFFAIFIWAFVWSVTR